MILRTAGIVGVACASLSAAALGAEPTLGEAVCARLKDEQARLEKAGIPADMDKGADWGKANLPASRLAEIKDYIGLAEQLKFGCRQAQVTPEAKAAGEAAKAIEANPTTKVIEAPKKKKRKPAGTAAATDATAQEAPASAPAEAGVLKPAVQAAPPAKAISPKPGTPAGGGATP